MASLKKAVGVAITTLVSVLAIACDPGVRLEPVGWKASQDYQWEAQANGIGFVVSALGGLIGNEFVVFEITAQNRTSSRFVIDSATLETNGRIYSAGFAGQGEEKFRSAEAGTVERISLYWSFGQPLYEVFGEAAAMRLAFRVGANDHETRIDFRLSE